ncbi:MAG TPA: hypothetical protein DCY94_01725, partial [Firmicutes bacterium]|nr:hypothetical protein [Bacillota bacterium]
MKNKEIFVQESPSSCGACSIASIVSHYGGYVPLEIIMEDTFTDKNGTNALNIKRTLEKYGFECVGLKLNLSELKTCQFPLIAHISKDGYEHFLVIYGISEDKVETMDPAVGKKTYTLKEFASITTKTFISAVPRGTIPKYASSKSLLGILDPFMRKSTKSTRLILLASLVILFLSLIVSFHLKIFDKSDNLVASLFILIVIEIIVAFIEYLRTFILTGLIKNVDNESIHEFERHIFHLPIKNIKNKRVGEIIKKIEDMTFVKDLFIKFTIETPLDILTVFVIGLLMSILSLKMTLIYSLIIVVYLSLTIAGNKHIFKREKRVQQKRENYMGTLVEYLDGLESIKNLNGEAKFLK